MLDRGNAGSRTGFVAFSARRARYANAADESAGGFDRETARYRNDTRGRQIYKGSWFRDGEIDEEQTRTFEGGSVTSVTETAEIDPGGRNELNRAMTSGRAIANPTRRPARAEALLRSARMYLFGTRCNHHSFSR